MSWLGALAGVVLVWAVSAVLGWREGGMVVLAAVAGAWIGALHRRIARGEAEWRERLARVEARARAATVVAPVATAAAPAPEPEPVAEAPTVAAPAPAFEPAWVPDRSSPALVAATPAPPPTVEVEESALPITTSIGQSVLAWFKGGNTIVRIAVVLLFIGAAFLLRYAAEHALIPIELRVALVALGGLALAIVGWRLRQTRRGYGLSLQGAGVGIVYLTLFAAMRLYQLVPPALTFALLAVLAAVTALLAVRQNALPLAVLGFGGGFLAPVLASTGSGNHVALFSFYAVLNLAIAWIARRQAWKLLNLVGFVFTFSIGALWGVRAYTPAHFASTEPFLVAHFLLYLYIAVQYTRQLVASSDASALRVPVVDGGLLFGVPIAAFGLQAAMLHDRPLALALSAAVMSAVYLVVGWRLWREAGERMLLLVEGLLALGVIFLILVTPLALDARWTGAAWAVQGSGIVWVALRQKRWWAAGIGGLLQIAGAFVHWSGAFREDEAWPFANTVFVGVALIAASALLTARLLQRQLKLEAQGPQLKLLLQGGHALALALGVAHAVLGALPEVRQLAQPFVVHSLSAALVFALAVLALDLARPRLDWPELQVAARVVLVIAWLASLAAAIEWLDSGSRLWNHYLPGGAWAEAVGLLLLGRWLLRRVDAARLQPFEPVAWAWFGMLHGAFFLYAVFGHGVARHLAWTHAASVVPPILALLWLLRCAQREQWPVAGRWRAFDWGLMRPWLVLLALWSLAVNAFSDGAMRPLPYLPFVNPLDLVHGLILLAAWQWWRVSGVHSRAVLGAAAVLGFWWLNGLLVRTLHHWAGTPMWIDGALDSGTVQTGLTILWTLTALVAMLVATRVGQRLAWMAGAALLGLVVVKLFFVDLSNVGALARIVSFLGVGALMLVIGYLSPLPPAIKEQRG